MRHERVEIFCGALCFIRQADDVSPSPLQALLPFVDLDVARGLGWFHLPRGDTRFYPDDQGPQRWACPACALELNLVKPLTPGFQKALELLKKQEEPLPPRAFALLMWPDSPYWKKSYKCGPYGSTRGKAMWRSGGALLGRLARWDLTREHYEKLHYKDSLRSYSVGYKITWAGLKALEWGFYEVPPQRRTK